MKASKLRPIILRLEAMVKDKTSEIQERRFDVDGVERVRVQYDHQRKVFTLFDHSIEEQLEFDNIDFAAVEILELIQPVLPEEN